MADADGAVRVRHDERAITCQVKGWGTMRLAPAFQAFVEQALAAGPVSLRIDLRDCTYLDSTFLGALVVLKREVDRQGGSDFTLVSPSPQCRQVIGTMRLDRLLPIIEADPPPVDGPWIELESEPDDRGLKRTVVEAHGELAQVPGPTGDMFREIAAQLREEWEAEERAASR